MSWYWSIQSSGIQKYLFHNFPLTLDPWPYSNWVLELTWANGVCGVKCKWWRKSVSHLSLCPTSGINVSVVIHHPEAEMIRVIHHLPAASVCRGHRSVRLHRKFKSSDEERLCIRGRRKRFNFISLSQWFMGNVVMWEEEEVITC